MAIRNFRLFFGGQLISQVGNWLTLVAQTLLVLHLTGNGLAVGIVAGCQFAPVLVLGAWAGLVADRSDKRKLLLIVQTFAMLQSFALATLAFLPHTPVVGIYLVALLGGIATAFDNPARRAFVVEMVPTDDVQNAVSLNSALMTASRIVGPALAGLLVVTVGYGWCFTLDGISYLAVIAGLWMMNSAELHRGPATPRGKGQVREGLRYARSLPDLWIPLVMMAFVGTLAFNFQVVVPLLVKRTFHGGDVTFTLLFSVLSVGSLAGALAMARRTSTSIRQVVVGSAAFGVALLAFAAAPSLMTAFPIALAVGFTSMVFITGSTAIVQVRSDPSMRGRVLALQAIVFLGTTPIGAPILGLVCDVWNPRVGLVIGGLGALTAAAWGTVAEARWTRSTAPSARATGSPAMAGGAPPTPVHAAAARSAR
jgi:MFS family permease